MKSQTKNKLCRVCYKKELSISPREFYYPQCLTLPRKAKQKKHNYAEFVSYKLLY